MQSNNLDASSRSQKYDKQSKELKAKQDIRSKPILNPDEVVLFNASVRIYCTYLGLSSSASVSNVELRKSVMDISILEAKLLLEKIL